MDWTGIIWAAAIVGGTGLIIGLLLGIAGRKFAIKVNEMEVAVREMLPGNNCGGCGYPGCDGLAAAIASGKAPVDGCPVGGAAVAGRIARIMGQQVKEHERMVAFVKCSGTCEKSHVAYQYTGVEDCAMMAFVPAGGAKECTYGCRGYGTCVKACPFGAIQIVEGIAKVDREKCKGCGKCAAKCPLGLIEMTPYRQKIHVACSSKAKGKVVMAACEVGCIGCKKCEKNCPVQAITVTDNVAHIDHTKCTGCKTCVENCPRDCITVEEPG